jgi:hypothetical protein
MAARLRDLAITNVPFPEHAAVSRDDHSCRLRQVRRGIVLAVYDSHTSPKHLTAGDSESAGKRLMAKSDQVIGRVAEKRVLDTVLASRDPELVAVYGRRRVGRGSGTEEGAGI